MPTATEIARSLVNDLGCAESGAAYARRIARQGGADATAYSDAASLLADERFTLRNDERVPRLWQPPEQPKGTQKMLFTGLDLLPGQLDFFEES